MNYFAIPLIKRSLIEQQRPDIAKVVILTSEVMNVSLKDMLRKCRKRHIVNARYVCYHVAREQLKATLSEIGKYFSRDHTTIVHGLQTFNDLLPHNPRFAEAVATINSRL